MDLNLVAIIGLAVLTAVLVARLRADMNRRMDRLETAQAERLGQIEPTPSGHDAASPEIGATLSEHGERLTRIEAMQTEQGERLTRIETAQTEQGERLARIEATLSEHDAIDREIAQTEQDEHLARIEATLSEHRATDRESKLDRERILQEAAARSKYAPLYRYLSARCDEEWFASFGQIEAILGFRLPDSAHLYPAWWSNGGRSQALAWLAAGWRTRSIDLEEETLVFERMAPARPDPDDGDLWWE